MRPGGSFERGKAQIMPQPDAEKWTAEFDVPNDDLRPDCQPESRSKMAIGMDLFPN